MTSTLVVQEILDGHGDAWAVCLSCGRLAKRVNPGPVCRFCRSKRLSLVRLELRAELGVEDESGND